MPVRSHASSWDGASSRLLVAGDNFIVRDHSGDRLSSLVLLLSHTHRTLRFVCVLRCLCESEWPAVWMLVNLPNQHALHYTTNIALVHYYRHACRESQYVDALS